MDIHKACKQLSVCDNKEKGAAALLTIVIIAAAVLIMVYNASLLGLGELDLGYTSQKGGEAQSIADGCIEEALRRIRLDANYSGDSLNLGAGSCIMTVSTSDNISTITVTANIDSEYYKKIEVVADLNESPIVITSWKEKND